VIIKDGETVVIGGVFKTSFQDSSSGVPGLKDIPILGYLFKNTKKNEESSELLIFVTPRIVKKQ
jgi:type II secretory pathway component HofQ